MKKYILALLIIGLVCAIIACKSNIDESGKDQTSTAAETSEAADGGTFEPMEAEEYLEIELEEGQEGEVAPD